MTDDYKIRGEDIDVMHALDVKQTAACIKKLGWPAVKEAVFDFTRTHFDLPCYLCEPCHFLNKTGQCTYGWPELEQNNASSAGRTQTGADSPPFTSTDVIGPRHHTKKQKGSHSVMPSGTKSGSNPSVSPYPPVRYEWEIE